MNDNRNDWKKKERTKAPLKLLPNRQYRKRGNTLVRVKVAPEVAKPCRVRFVPTGQYMAFLEAEKMLTHVAGNLQMYVFASNSAAKRARWHTVMQSGVPGSHVDYEIVPLK